MPFYQPIVRLSTGALSGLRGAGALAPPRRGLVMPDELPAALRRDGLMAELGAMMMREASQQLATGASATAPPAS
jgi:c-di-GMP-specific phosphodiesterase